MRSRALDFFIEPASPRVDVPPAAAPRPHASPAPRLEARPAAAPCPSHAPPASRLEAPPAAAPCPSHASPASHATSSTARAASRPTFAAPVAAARPAYAAPRSRAAVRMPLRAAVLGSAAEAVPVGALVANALRSAVGASSAVLAVWAPDATAARGGPATLGASRLAARLSARGLPAAARGRLAWMALDDHPVAAAVAARRAAGALEVPLVVVLCGPRCDVVEGLLAEQDLVVVVIADLDGPLARLAVAGCATAALACAPPAPGPSRWVARSGIAGTRGLTAPLRDLVRELAAHPAPEPVEVAW